MKNGVKGRTLLNTFLSLSPHYQYSQLVLWTDCSFTAEEVKLWHWRFNQSYLFEYYYGVVISTVIISQRLALLVFNVFLMVISSYFFICINFPQCFVRTPTTAHTQWWSRVDPRWFGAVWKVSFLTFFWSTNVQKVQWTPEFQLERGSIVLSALFLFWLTDWMAAWLVYCCPHTI